MGELDMTCNSHLKIVLGKNF